MPTQNTSAQPDDRWLAWALDLEQRAARESAPRRLSVAPMRAEFLPNLLRLGVGLGARYQADEDSGE